MTVTACTGTTATVTRGVSGNDCVILTGQLVTCGPAIAHDDGSFANQWGNLAVQSSNITNTNGYTWTPIMRVSSGPFADLDDVQGSLWMATVPMNTATTDTITFNDSNSTFSFLHAVIYSGLGSLEAGTVYTIAQGGGGPGGTNAITGPYPSQPGDINIALVGGAPTTVIPTSPPTTIRSADARPSGVFIDQYSVSSVANIGTYMNSEGPSVIGMAFQPATPATFGRSIVLSSQSAFNSSIPGIASNATMRMEVSMHDWGNQSIFEHPIQNLAGDLEYVLVCWRNRAVHAAYGASQHRTE